MNVLKAIKVAEIRNKLSVIPAKLIIAAILTIAVYWEKSMGFDPALIFGGIKTDPKKYIVMLVIAYGAVSFVYFFIRLMHNWIFGVILSVGVAALVITQAGKLGKRTLLVALIVMIFGGPILDLINLLRYHALKREVIRAEEERLESSYGNGYDDGFARGMREGERIRMQYSGRYDDGYDDRLERRYDGRSGERYDDRLSGGYDEDGYYEEEYDGEYIGADDDRYGYDEYSDENDGGYDGYSDGHDGYSDGYDDYDDGAGGYDRKITAGNSEDAAGFFADCKTNSEIKRRYHDLCKVYHPDSGNGSAELFYRIKNEYDRLMAKP